MKGTEKKNRGHKIQKKIDICHRFGLLELKHLR